MSERAFKTSVKKPHMQQKLGIGGYYSAVNSTYFSESERGVVAMSEKSSRQDPHLAGAVSSRRRLPLAGPRTLARIEEELDKR